MWLSLASTLSVPVGGVSKPVLDQLERSFLKASVSLELLLSVNTLVVGCRMELLETLYLTKLELEHYCQCKLNEQ